MAIILGDSLDSYASTAEMTSSQRWVGLPSNGYGAGQLVAGAGRFGGNAYNWCCTQQDFSGQSKQLQTFAMTPIYVPAFTGKTYNTMQGTSIAWGFWFKTGTAANASGTYSVLSAYAGAGPISVNSSASPFLSLTHTANATSTTPSTVTLTQFGGGSVLASGSCPVDLMDGNWHWIEIGMTLTGNSPAAGGATAQYGAGFPNWWTRMYVDQTLVINFTGGGSVSTCANSAAAFGMVLYHANVPMAIANAFFIDDIIVTWGGAGALANFPYGPRRMACLRPVANGDQIGFVPNGAADNYSAINKGYSNTTSYVQSTGFNVEDRYKFPQLSYVPQNINAVIANIQAGNFENGTTVGMSPIMNDGATEVVGTRITLPPTTYQPFQTVYETDGSGANWTTSEVNSIQLGFKSVA